MSNYRPVYSDETGRLCLKCGKPIKGCICKNPGQQKRGTVLSGSAAQPPVAKEKG